MYYFNQSWKLPAYLDGELHENLSGGRLAVDWTVRGWNSFGGPWGPPSLLCEVILPRGKWTI
jgi:hypothetical protein